VNAADAYETLNTKPECYAQEPVYSQLDKKFLSTMSIATVRDPAGFDLVTNDSFVYCPGAELDVEMGILFKSPAFVLAGKLDAFWRNQKGEAMTDRKARYFPSDDSEEMIQGSVNPKENENECRILENFNSDHHGVQIPDFDAKDYPFYQHFFYYPQESNDGEEEVLSKEKDADPITTDDCALPNRG
jgi:hypothetical protein